MVEESTVNTETVMLSEWKKMTLSIYLTAEIKD
jgi:hypothetical protein